MKIFESGRKVQKVCEEKVKKGGKVIIQLVLEHNREYGSWRNEVYILFYVQIHTHNPLHFTDVFFS